VATAPAKSIDGRNLTGNMFLNLALEYVDLLNANETVAILPCFERVVLIESKSYSEKLFESIKDKIRKDCQDSKLPMAEDHLLKM
jgi:hypothetical protein